MRFSNRILSNKLTINPSKQSRNVSQQNNVISGATHHAPREIVSTKEEI
jgi:hypothetical protein